VLSPNDVRREEGWPASTDPTADSIEPPNMSALAAVPIEDDPPTPTLRHIAGTRWSTKRYLNMELLRQRNAMIA
jgi:hypothetical protein